VIKLVSDVGIITTSIISLAGMVLFFIINNNNWFKRQNFKLQAQNVKAENKLKLKKLEKELGLESKKKGIDLGGLDIPSLIAQYAAGGGESDEGGVGGVISEFVQDNPELVQSLLSGIGGNKGENKGGGGY